MKTSSTWNLGSVVGKFMMGLVLTVMIVSMDAGPAFAKDHNKGRHDNGRYEQRDRGYDRRPRARVHARPPVYRPYGYSYGYRGRVYTPPPVIYAPPPPPGIGIFFPPILFPSIVIHP